MSRKTDEARREERRKQVAANLLAGLNYRDMADALGVSLGTISADVRMILGRWQREQVETIDDWVVVQCRQIDRALNAIWSKVLDGDLAAIDRAVKLMERKSKLLGMDKPEKREHSGTVEVKQNWDLSKLTIEELEALNAITSKLGV